MINTADGVHIPLYTLQKMEAVLERLEEQVVGLRIEVAALKVKSGIWGAVAGLASATLVVVGWFLSR